MEFIEFKIRTIQKNSFLDIFEECKINCSQWTFNRDGDLTIAHIPKYAVDKMTPEQIELLRSFVVQ